ncbi:TlpA family protein disulfide reductase [Algibacter sp. Ld11]|uniref:TlpA family protein disulfide reductase n=1 Tax=Algibacter sp. Ld11 TaxID=649150 RepID=UPI003867C444
MKKSLIVLGIAYCFFSCKEHASTKQSLKEDYTIISGKIVNTDTKKIDLTSSVMFSANPNPKYSIPVLKDGTFRDTLTLTPGHYQFTEGENSTELHLFKGADINISYNAKDFKKTLNFSGKGSGVAKFLLEKNKITTKVYARDSVTGTNIYNNTEKDFKAKIDLVKSDLELALSSNKNISEDIRAIEKRDIHYLHVDFINRFKGVHAFISGDSTYIPSKKFTKELDELTYDNEEDFIYSRTYAYLLLEHFRDKAIKKESERYPSNMELLKSFLNIPNESIKNTMLAFYGKSSLPRAKNLKDMYTLLNSNSTNNKDKESFTQLYNDLKLLTKGQPSPMFENYENYEGGAMSLKDLKGKYVFIDVWATWCGPCKYEIPYLEKLEKEYHNKNVAFISLSVDRKNAYDAWKEMIKNKNMGGIQLLADHDFKSKFIQDYKIRAIPRFILIDPQGNIISANAPKPSSAEIRPLLDELIN